MRCFNGFNGYTLKSQKLSHSLLDFNTLRFRKLSKVIEIQRTIKAELRKTLRIDRGGKQ
jgi:hypothetical protein